MKIKIDENFLTEYLGLVKNIASKNLVNSPKWVSKEDVIHSGIVGLFCAVERFDHSRGVKFEVFAFHKIRGHVLDSLTLQKVVKVPRAEIKKKSKKFLGILENLEDQKTESGLLKVQEAEERNFFRLAVQELNDRERQIIDLYYYQGLVMKEVAKIMGLSEGRISQVRSLAIKKMFNSRHLKHYKNGGNHFE